MEKVVHRTTLHAPSQDRAYWLSRTLEERIAAVEFLRQQFHPEYDLLAMKVEKVVRIINLKDKKQLTS
jgi:hypothetical protein